MSIGATVRRMFGPHERRVAELWRAMFIDLDDWTRQLLHWVPAAERILEIGCGEGAGTERLAMAYPEGEILAIDIGEHLGRLYQGPLERVTFRKMTVQALASQQAGNFDLIVMCDVMHHIPPSMRREIIAAARALLAPHGKFVFKDWERRATPIHWAAHAADRWLSGDDVQFLTCDEAEDLLAASFDSTSPSQQARIKPWRNNFALLLQPRA